MSVPRKLDSLGLSVEVFYPGEHRGARRHLDDFGYVVIKDDAAFRTQVVLSGDNLTGQYTSYYDPSLQGIVIFTHDKLRKVIAKAASNAF